MCGLLQQCGDPGEGAARPWGTRGLDLDKDAIEAAVGLPFHNGGTEGVNTKTKRIMRQMHGRTGFALLRHRILLG